MVGKMVTEQRPLYLQLCLGLPEQEIQNLRLTVITADHCLHAWSDGERSYLEKIETAVITVPPG